MRVLVTGGAGYVGSHTLFELLGAGHEVLVVDSHVNSAPEALDRVAELAGRDVARLVCDLRETARLTTACRDFEPDTVIHFAGLKAVGESVDKPVLYYDNNVGGTLSLIAAMGASGCRRIVFSSSATVYGAPRYLPCDEAHPLAPLNPYGRTKLMIEQILGDWVAAEGGRKSAASAVLLRYFNPVGAHASGLIGEDPRGIPNNLMPLVCQVAAGRRPALEVYGDDYNTPDGTGMRDYIHVCDLARAHVAALDRAATHAGAEAINVGTGRGTSVRELVSAFERASGRQIPVRVAPRRAGDVAASLADPAKAHELLGWRAELDLAEMCRSAWAWQQKNPLGYAD